MLYSIYNIQRHVSIKSLIFFKLWITRITLLVWMPGRFRTKMKNTINKSPYKRESYKVHSINFFLLPSLPLPVHQLQPMGRPALPDLLLGLHASPRMPPSLSGGEKVNFTMTALRGFRSCLKRQVNEAVRIDSSQADVLLNSKSEFHQAPLTRMVAFSGLHGDQGEDQAGQVFLLAGAGERAS